MKGIFTEIIGGDAEEKTITVDWVDHDDFSVIIGQKVILAQGEPVEIMENKIKELEEKIKRYDEEIEHIENLEIFDFSHMANYQTQVRNAIYRMRKTDRTIS